MNEQKPIYCPLCNKLLDRRELRSDEIFKKHCGECGIDIVYEVNVSLKVFTEVKPEVKSKIK